MTNHWVDIKNAELVFVMGGNPAEAHPCGFKWVIEAKKTRKAKLVVVDPRFNRTVDTATGYRTTSVLTIPVKARDGRKLGVMQALNSTDGKPFTDADVARMTALSARASPPGRTGVLRQAASMRRERTRRRTA